MALQQIGPEEWLDVERVEYFKYQKQATPDKDYILVRTFGGHELRFEGDDARKVRVLLLQIKGAKQFGAI
jgi:hypothetical protein